MLLQRFEVSSLIWQQETFRIFGRHVVAPRSLMWFGNKDVNYRYTGIDHVAAGWPDWLNEVRYKVESVADVSFNFLLVNRYLDGQQHMGWHRDDEKGADPMIASISLGAQRPFVLRYPSETSSRRVLLEHGSLCLFDGRIRHRLPPSKKILQPRINLTFRKISVNVS